MPEQLDENGDPIEPEERVEVTPPLKAVEGEQWSFRLCPQGSGESANSVVAGRSLLYPGAVAIAAGRNRRGRELLRVDVAIDSHHIER